MGIRLLGNALLLLVAVAVALALGEFAARLFVPGWAPDQAYRIFWQYDPLLGWSNRPGARGMHRSPDFETYVEISSQGLRDRVYPLERVPGKGRILLLGDSYTWGFGVEREQIWHELIEARHPDWELINTGVAGYGTGQELLYFDERGRAFHPDVVLLLVHQTDFKDNNEKVVYGYYKPTFVPRPDGGLDLTQVPVPQLGADLRFDRWLRAHTWFLYRLYHLGEFVEAAREQRAEDRREAEAKRREAARQARSQAARAAGSEGSVARADPHRAARREARRAERERERQQERARPAKHSKFDVDQTVTERLLAKLKALVEESGARFLLVSTPMPDPPRGPFLERLRRLGIVHLDLEDAFRGQTDYRFRHDAHWTPKGNAIAADAVEAFLKAQGVFARGASAAQSGPSDPSTRGAGGEVACSDRGTCR
jgi:hypothetical protein